MKALTLAFQDDPRFAELKKHRDESGGIHHVWGMDRRITPLLMEALSDTKRFRLIVTYEERRAREIVEDYRFYSRQTFYYPAKDALFYSADIHSVTIPCRSVWRFSRRSQKGDHVPLLRPSRD